MRLDGQTWEGASALRLLLLPPPLPPASQS